MKVDVSVKGFASALVYGVAGVYSWIDKSAIDAYSVSVLLLFMVMDFVLGVWKSVVVTEAEKPTSKKAKKGILAKVVMLTLPIVCGLIWGKFDPQDGFRVANTMLVLLMVSEGYSVLSNAYAIRTQKEFTEFDAITFIFKKVTEQIKNLLEKLIQ